MEEECFPTKEATTQFQLYGDVSFQLNHCVQGYEEELWDEKSLKKKEIDVDQETPYHYMKIGFLFWSENSSLQGI